MVDSQLIKVNRTDEASVGKKSLFVVNQWLWLCFLIEKGSNLICRTLSLRYVFSQFLKYIC